MIINSVLLSFMFSLLSFHLAGDAVVDGNILFSKFVSISFFLFFLFFLRLIFMKVVAYYDGFELDMKLIWINRYWFRAWDKISYWWFTPISRKGIPIYVLSLFLYFLSFGFFVFPNFINYDYKKIPHRYFLTEKHFENYPTHRHVSDYRFSKSLFAGVLFYFLFAFAMKYCVDVFNYSFFSIYIIILFYVAIFSTLPIPLTEGYELYSRNKSAWIAGISILILGFFALIVFKNIFLIIGLTFLSIIIISITILWRKLM